jgi:cytochrome c oxidase cbb3-type subunit 3
MTRKPIRYLLMFLVTLMMVLAGTTVVLAQSGSNPQDVAEGARLFTENCAICHGSQGEGRVGATLSKDWPSIRPDLSIRAIIENGVTGSPMPAWSQPKGGPLTETEIDALVTYILTWESGEPYVPEYSQVYLPRTPIITVEYADGDPNVGAILYDVNCAACHGRNGEGRIGVTLAKNWPSIRADLTIQTTIENGVPGSTMPAWSQFNGGSLTEQDIHDIVAFILTMPVISTQGVEFTPSSPSVTPANGLVGVALTVILFVLLVGVILFLQRKK